MWVICSIETTLSHFAPVEFVAPFSFQPYRWMSEGQWMKKPFEGMLRLVDSKTRNF